MGPVCVPRLSYDCSITELSACGVVGISFLSNTVWTFVLLEFSGGQAEQGMSIKIQGMHMSHTLRYENLKIVVLALRTISEIQEICVT